jgi:glycerophosphoryl diester phosphodiesterase
VKPRHLPATAALCLALAFGAAAPAAAQTVPAPAPNGPPAPAAAGAHFDLQAHRGGIGLTVEGTLPAFAAALRTGVSTLELDLQITRDGREVITHDRRIDGRKCLDTAPLVPGDPQFPYVGKYVKDLTFDQVRTLDCGSRGLAAYPGQVTAPGAKMPTLAELFALTKQHRASQVEFNIETKVEAGAPEQTAPREQFVEVALREIQAAGMGGRVSIQSFDWGALRLVQEQAPEIPTVALTNKDFLQVGQPGASPWLGGIDADDFGGDLINAASALGFDAVSPVHGSPQNGTVSDPNYAPYVTADMVQRAHWAGMEITPWTVNDPATMAALIDLGVDGIITDYPDRLRGVLAAKSMKLPHQYKEPKAHS